MIIPSDCERCGACCRSDSSTFVPVNPEDQLRLGTNLATLTRRQDREVYMRMQDGACIALEVLDGISRCTIYHQRPELCREFKQASPECRSVLVAMHKAAMRPPRGSASR